jgi:hypothetical protein
MPLIMVRPDREPLPTVKIASRRRSSVRTHWLRAWVTPAAPLPDAVPKQVVLTAARKSTSGVGTGV